MSCKSECHEQRLFSDLLYAPRAASTSRNSHLLSIHTNIHLSFAELSGSTPALTEAALAEAPRRCL